jgi:hypothetical protein
MSRKIIGITVGTSLPKPNFNQTDPTKGDYIKGDIVAAIPTDTTLTQDGHVADAKAVGDKFATLIGDIPVSEQISNAFADYSSGAEVYSQNDEPEDAPEGSLWVDLDAVTEHTADKALTLTSPGGKKFKITIDDDGVLTATEVVDSEA